MNKKFYLAVGLLSIKLAVVHASAVANECMTSDYCFGCPCEGRFNVEIDWLHWKVEQDGLRIGSYVDVTSGSNSVGIDAAGVGVDFHYSDGFRVDVGYTFPYPHTLWEINAIYTHLPVRSSSKTLATTSISQLIVPDSTGFPIFNALGQGGGSATFNEFSFDWGGNLSYLDLDLARTLFFCDNFYLRPHVGFRATKMHQKLSMHGVLINTLDRVRLSLVEHFRGYGIEGGFWAGWQTRCGLSFVGHVGGSVLYSRFRLHQKARSDGASVARLKAKEVTHTATPTVDYFAGLEYAVNYGNIAFFALIGWEQRVFFDFNHLSTFGGNFSTQGATVSLGAEF